MQVWEVVPRPTHQKVIGARRVDTNKGDSAKPVYRSRYVAKELKATTVGDFFAASAGVPENSHGARHNEGVPQRLGKDRV